MGSGKDKISVCPQCERVKKYGKFTELTLTETEELERNQNLIEFVPTTCSECVGNTT